MRGHCQDRSEATYAHGPRQVLAGLLEFVWPGSRLVLDRGYSGMRTACIPRDIFVTMPPFRHRLKKGQKAAERVQLSSDSCRRGKGFVGYGRCCHLMTALVNGLSLTLYKCKWRLNDSTAHG